jgi:HTH-type transcriptional regulator / antitoxin HigA
MDTVLAEAFPAGGYLADELEERGWTQVDFAEILGRPPQFVSEIISGKKEITRESAAQIGAALGTSAEIWLNLQDAYYLWLQRQDRQIQDALEDVRLRARLQELAPMTVLRKRGLITESSTRGQAEQLQDLFGLKSIYEEPKLPMMARRSNHTERVSPTQLTWLACVYRKAASIRTSTYSAARFRSLAEHLSQALNTPPSFRTLPKSLADVGVRIVYVEAFPSSKIDGAAFLLDGSPTIGISGRGQRLDKVLFTILHEAAHIVLSHVDEGLILDEKDQNVSDQEKAASDLAARWSLPKPLPRPPDRISQGWVIANARNQGVHPIVLVGRLQYEGVLTWRTALTKDAPTVTEYLRDW